MKIGALYKRTTDSEHRQGARKALLIGINYDTQASRDPDSTATALLNCHRDIVAMRKLLIDCYSYKASDIVVMLDADNYLQPTHNNMILAMDDLVKGARPGDRLVFMFAGHCCQIPCHHHSEADDFDEALMPMDHEGTRNKAKLIIDNHLRQRLVNPLSPGVRLTAILDACHSGTLLDLDHYMCNMVYTPRISRGPRGSGSWRQAVQRKTAIVPPPPQKQKTKPRRRFSAPPRMSSMDHIFSVFRDSVPQVDRTPTFLSQSRLSVVSEAESSDAPGAPEPRKGRVIARATRTLVRPWKEAFALVIRRYQSPSPVPSIRCDGWCVPTSASMKSVPRVISIAACGDPQQTWEDPRGRSMSMTLVEELRRNPHPVLKDLVMRLMHARDNVSLRLHAAAKRQRKKGHDSSCVLDGVNFQDVQVGSQEKLDMEVIVFEF
ncbi:caspase domain-containing protein [Rhodofomes roseus]|uniref:Caspase domain-containing protein n=1 Tax=Rhodofomes roseus TaxID=34475 RepID=A0ABQ8KEI1_9APHY|nr:caspase domain-containing protein [Rhodofomes roseus]KAH9836126.1 caspase domain-containing protein [Rhodofomes roseus]